MPAHGGVARVAGLILAPTAIQPGSVYSLNVPALAEGAYDVEWLDAGKLVASAERAFTVGNDIHFSQRPFEAPEEAPASPTSRKGYQYYKSQSGIVLDRSFDDEVWNQPLRGFSIRKDSIAVRSETGEAVIKTLDLVIPGRGLDFVWARTYRSRTGSTSPMGVNWDHSYNLYIEADGENIAVHDGTGRRDVYFLQADGSFTRDESFCRGRMDSISGNFILEFPDTGFWEFFHFNVRPVGGRIARSVDRNGNSIEFQYDGQARLTIVTDTLGRACTLAYNADGFIESVTDFTGRAMRYGYARSVAGVTPPGVLTSVTNPPVAGTPNGNDFPNGKVTRYDYSSGFADERLNRNLTSITDPLGQAWLQLVYRTNTDPASVGFDTVDVAQRGPQRTQLRRVPQTPAPANQFAVMKCIVNDGVGNVTECFYDSQNRLLRQLDYTGRANPDLPTTETLNRPVNKLRAADPDFYETRLEWNPDSLCTRVVHPRSNVTEMIYQRVFNQNSSRSNNRRRSDGNLRVLRERACCGGADTDGDGTADLTERESRFDYSPDFGSPCAVTLPAFMKNARKAKTSEAVTNVKKMHDGARTRVLWGLGGNLDFVVRSIDPRGTVSTATCDARGSLLHTETTERKSGQLIAADFNYNSAGQLTGVTNAADAGGARRVDTFNYHSSGPQQGYLQSVVTDDGAVGLRLTTSYEYDARGNRTRCVDPRGFDTIFTYNALDQLVRAQTPPNTTYPYIQWQVDLSYDANDNVFRADTANRDHTGGLGVNPFWRTECQYDLLNRRTACWVDKDGTLVYLCDEYQYDANDNVVLHRSPEAVAGRDPNAVTRFEYDERDLLLRELPAPGTGLSAITQFDYDGNANCTRVNKVDALVIKQTTAVFDGFDRCVRATDPMGNVETCAYDANGNLVFQRLDGELNDIAGSAGNRRLRETRYEYDSLNRVTRFRPSFFDVFTELAIDDGEATTSFTYAPNGLLLSETDDNGNTTRRAYDPAWRLATVTDAKTNVTAWLYDACGNPTTVTSIERSDLGGAEQRFSVSREYDPRGRLTRSTDNAGNSDQYFYDSRDNLVRHLDPRGSLTGWTYDGLNRCTVVVADLNGDGLLDDVADISSAQSWDDNSRLASSTDDNGNLTRYSYDALDRRIATTNADLTVERLVWSPQGNPASRTDPNGTVTRFTHDLLDRCTRKDILPGPGVAATTTFETFEYDGESRLVRAANNGIAHTFAWNSLSDLAGQSSGGLTLLSTHDAVGNRLSSTYPSGLVVQHSYDSLNRPATLSSVGSGGLTQHATCAYDGPSRLARVARANGIHTRINWSGLQNPANSAGDFGWQQVLRVNHQVTASGAFIDTRSFAYDRAQNKIVRAQLAPFSTGGPATTNVFAYDRLHRLTRGIRSSGTAIEKDTQYQLDGNGNRQQVVENGAARLYQMIAATPEPADFQMNQYSRSPFGSHEYDRNGNLVSTDVGAGPRLFHFDYADRLVLVERTIGPSVVAVAAYAYDALGRRVSKTVFLPAPMAPETTTYFYDADGGGDGIIEARKQGERFQFIHNLGRPWVLFTPLGETLYFHDDDLGNMLALTDAAGRIVERYDYDDYGLPRFLDVKGDLLADANGQLLTESPAGNPFLFHGMEWDAKTGLYHDKGLTGNNPLYEGKRLYVGGLSWSSGGEAYDPRLGRGYTRLKRELIIERERKGGFLAAGGNNPWSGGSAMQKGTVKFFNETKGFGRGTGGGGDSQRGKGIIKVITSSSGGTSMAVQFNPKEYTLTKSAGASGRVLNWGAVRSSVQDFEKNTENVSGGFGLMGPNPSVPGNSMTEGKWKPYRGGGLILHESAGVTR